VIFSPARIDQAWLLEPELRLDERGFFARIWCREELDRQGLDNSLAQESISYNRLAGTLRGLHFQRTPHTETKIVRCTHGAIFDVIVDLRRRSSTYLKWEGFELIAKDRQGLYIPKGCAHGFQTLTDDAEVSYQISMPHIPEAAGGYRYDDPTFNIAWPRPVTVISQRDLNWPLFSRDVPSF